jgi:hypothetical protein
MEISADPAQDPETIFGIREQRFRLWALPGGRTVVTSRPIEPNVAKRAQLRLSARGNFVLVFWKHGDKPVLVYEVPSCSPVLVLAYLLFGGTFPPCGA